MMTKKKVKNLTALYIYQEISGKYLSARIVTSAGLQSGGQNVCFFTRVKVETVGKDKSIVR